jgi:hypothetical protein
MRDAPSSRAWLALTPEPERELPPAIAVLRAGGPVPDAVVAVERDRARALVLRGTERRYLDWLAEAARLARHAGAADPAVARAARVVRDVVANQAGLLLGLPGGGRRREAVRRALEVAAR